MNNFNIGDKVRIKKLSNKEFEEIYHKKYKGNIPYNKYLDYHIEYFNQTFEIKKIIVNRIYCKNCDFWFFKEEVECDFKEKNKNEDKLDNNIKNQYEIANSLKKELINKLNQYDSNYINLIENVFNNYENIINKLINTEE